jgi:hypothetical protein
VRIGDASGWWNHGRARAQRCAAITEGFLAADERE